MVVEVTEVHPGMLSWIGPVVAPFGTVTVIKVSALMMKGADVPLNSTAVTCEKPDPLKVTAAPAPPLVGKNEVNANPSSV